MTMEGLYAENWPIVYGYLLSLGCSRAQAEDLTSETFLRAVQKPDAYDGTCKPSTWLCTIAKHLYFSECRRRKRLVPLEETETPVDCGLEERFLDQDQARRILKLARDLGELPRQVFFMRVEGMTFRQIGDALGRTENWARVTFFRAKAHILERLEETP